MRITNSEIKQLNDILIKMGYSSSSYDISRTEDRWQIKVKPNDFYFILKRRATDYVITRCYADKIPISPVTKKTFLDAKNLFSVWSNQIWAEIITDPNFKSSKTHEFSNRINQISPKFQKIFNQSLEAEILGLNEICGLGYRKALEFLIKDYIMLKVPSNEHDFIKAKGIGICLDKYNEHLKRELKITSERAFWLGNDHAHYVVIWEDKSLADLKNLISDSVDWIERHEKVNELEKNMPNRRKK